MFDFLQDKKTTMVEPEDALEGRLDYPYPIPELHTVLGTPLRSPFPEGMHQVLLGMGCFWGAERALWQLDGVYTTAAGYAGGYTPYPTYREVCSGRTGHAEVVLVVYDPEQISLDAILKVFWESHDPTQGMRQGNDVGTQYRSVVYVEDANQLTTAIQSKERYEEALQERHPNAEITSELDMEKVFFYAEPEHQQYLDKNPNGYCGLQGTGVSCPVPLS